MTGMGTKAKRRNGAKTERAWCITTVTPVTHWTRANTTNHYGTKTGKTRKGQNRMDGGSKHNFNSGYNSKQIEAKINQTSLSNLCKTLLTRCIEEPELINNILPPKTLTLPKTQYTKKKEKEIISVTKIGIAIHGHRLWGNVKLWPNHRPRCTIRQAVNEGLPNTIWTHCKCNCRSTTAYCSQGFSKNRGHCSWVKT